MIYLAGHSLGAAHAALAAFSRLKRGLRVDGIYLFGCPQPGDKTIGRVLSTISVTSLKNRRDPITALPADLELLGEEYVPVAPFLSVDQSPPPIDPWGLFADHHSELYAAAALQLPATPALVSISDAAAAVLNLYYETGLWSWTHFIDGQYWAVRSFPDGAKLAVARGSTTNLDWLQDLDFNQTTMHGARVSQGFWAGVAPVEAELDQVLA
jgi:pimeloyl-ACP methyl ester carboxylesterase